MLLTSLGVEMVPDLPQVAVRVHRMIRNRTIVLKVELQHAIGLDVIESHSISS